MSIRVRRQDSGAVTITQTGHWLSRLLGLPFVGAGLYFLYVLIDAVREYIVSGATASEWVAALPGFFLIVLFGAIFAAPGLVLVFVASKVILDPVQGTVTDYDRYRRWRIRQHRPLADFERLQVRMTQTTSGSGSQRQTSSAYQVFLVPRPEDGKKPGRDDMIGLAVFGDRNADLEEANRFGKEMADRLGLAFTPRR